MRFAPFCILTLLVPCLTFAGDNLRIATFNINWGNPDLAGIKQTIQAANADIICIQESNAVSERFLRREFGNTYSHIRFKGHRGQYAAERFGFISKLPLQKVWFVPPVHGLFGTCFATVTHNGQSLQIVNVHLSPFTIPRGSGFAQAMQALSKVEGTHKKEFAAIEKLIDAKEPTLVCGDFNSLSTFVVPKRLQQLGFTDSYAVKNQNPDKRPTWRWPVGKLNLQFRIDYVFHSKHFETVRSKVIETKASDHFLVVTELKVTKAGGSAAASDSKLGHKPKSEPAARP